MQALSEYEKQVLSRDLCVIMNTKNMTQGDVSKESGVDQAAISRAIHCKLKRQSKAVLKLCAYVNMHRNKDTKSSIPEELEIAIGQYFAAGGRVRTLSEAIRNLTDAFAFQHLRSD